MINLSCYQSRYHSVQILLYLEDSDFVVIASYLGITIWIIRAYLIVIGYGWKATIFGLTVVK